MKYVIDMRTLTVVSLELDDTNVHDKEVLMNMTEKKHIFMSTDIK